MIAGSISVRISGRQLLRSDTVRGCGGPSLVVAPAFPYACIVNASLIGIATTLFVYVGPKAPQEFAPVMIGINI